MPKGDANNLRADLDDGFARVSNLLLEALCLADVTLGAVKTILFVMRRTYGWARGRDHVYKSDVIAAQEIADGTGLKLQTVRDALRSLRQKRVLLQVPGAPGGPCAYGINPEVSEWGAGDAAWDSFRARFRDAHSNGTYGRSDTLLSRQHPIGTTTPPLLPTQHPPCGVDNTPPVELTTGVPATSPYVPSPEGTPTESLQNDVQNDSTPFVGTAVAVPPLPPDDASEKPTEPTPAADPKPRSSLKRKRRSDAELAADTQAIREKLPETLLPTLDLWLDNLASHNNTGALTAGRVLSETQGFADLVLVHGLTEGAIRHGVTQALTRTDRRDGKPGVASIAFVLEVAAGFKAGGNGSAKRQELPDDLDATPAPPVDPFREMDIRAGRTAR